MKNEKTTNTKTNTVNNDDFKIIGKKFKFVVIINLTKTHIMKKTLFTAFLTLTTFVLFSQSGSNFTVRLNTLIPSGEFKDDDYDDFLLDGAGGAGAGIGLGFEFAKEIVIFLVLLVL